MNRTILCWLKIGVVLNIHCVRQTSHYFSMRFGNSVYVRYCCLCMKKLIKRFIKKKIYADWLVFFHIRCSIPLHCADRGFPLLPAPLWWIFPEEGPDCQEVSD